MRKKKRNPVSKESSGLREKAKGGLPDGALVFFNTLWIPADGAAREEEGEEKKEEKKRSQTRAYLHGDELDCEDTSGIPRVVTSGGVLSQGQPKWWRAGRRIWAKVCLARFILRHSVAAASSSLSSSACRALRRALHSPVLHLCPFCLFTYTAPPSPSPPASHSYVF